MKEALWVIISVVGYIIAGSMKSDGTRFSSECRKALAVRICCNIGDERHCQISNEKLINMESNAHRWYRE